MNEAKSKGYACPRCTVGRCTPRRTTFTEIYHGHLLAAPKVCAYVCDVCHFAEFEQDTLDALWEELYGEEPLDDFQSLPGQRRGSSYGDGSN